MISKFDAPAMAVKPYKKRPPREEWRLNELDVGGFEVRDVIEAPQDLAQGTVHRGLPFGAVRTKPLEDRGEIRAEQVLVRVPRQLPDSPRSDAATGRTDGDTAGGIYRPTFRLELVDTGLAPAHRTPTGLAPAVRRIVALNSDSAFKLMHGHGGSLGMS